MLQVFTEWTWKSFPNLKSSFWCDEQGRQGKCQKNNSPNDCNYGNKTRKQMSVKQSPLNMNFQIKQGTGLSDTMGFIFNLLNLMQTYEQTTESFSESPSRLILRFL